MVENSRPQGRLIQFFGKIPEGGYFLTKIDFVMKESTFNRRAYHAPLRIRIASAILFALVLCTTNVLAQSAAFTLVSPYTGLDADQSKVLNYATNQPRLGDVQHIAWATESLFDSNGKITIALPGENDGQPISFEVIGSHFANETDYAVYDKAEQGEIALYVTSQGRGGSITLLTSTYVLYPLGGTKGALIKTNPSEGEAGTCATDLPQPEETGYCEDDCGSDILDVLAMVTPGAQQWLDANYGLFGLWFLFVETNNINGAFINSIVSNKRVRVQIISYTPDFLLTTDILGDRNKLIVSTDAQQTLQQSGADVGILLTNQNYGSVFGIASSLDPTNTNKFCITQVAFVGPIRYTFAHELAHEIGCRHSSPLTTGCPHGKNMAIGKNTIMANNAANNTRIQHFSNPVVFFGGESTGTAGSRDNAAQIRGALCEVANNNSPVWFSTDYTHTSVTTGITPDCPFTATANVQPGMQEIWGNLWNCGTNYTYQWSWLTNNVTYTNFGTNSPTLNLSAAPNCPFFYLRLTVSTPIGCSITATKLLFCSQGLACRSSGQGDEETTVPILVEHDRIYPNPAQDRFSVSLEDFPVVASVRAISTNGTAVHTLPMLGYDKGLLTCNVSSLPAGLWFVEILGPDQRKVLKLAIVC